MMSPVKKTHKDQLIIDLLWDCGITVGLSGSSSDKFELIVHGGINKGFAENVVNDNRDEIEGELRLLQQAVFFIECADNLGFYFHGCDEEIGGEVLFAYDIDEDFSDEIFDSAHYLKEAIRFLSKSGFLEPRMLGDNEERLEA
jgi:hypothetical protein